MRGQSKHRQLIQNSQYAQQKQQQGQVSKPQSSQGSQDSHSSQISIPHAVTLMSYRINKLENSIMQNSQLSDEEGIISRLDSLERRSGSQGSHPQDLAEQIKKHISPYISKVLKEIKNIRSDMEPLKKQMNEPNNSNEMIEMRKEIECLRDMFNDLNARFESSIEIGDIDGEEVEEVEIIEEDVIDPEEIEVTKVDEEEEEVKPDPDSIINDINIDDINLDDDIEN